MSVEGDAEAVPIEPVTAKFYGREGVTLQRTQLPLLPCWAATIHKVQGLSLDAAVIDLGPKVFEDGMAGVNVYDNNCCCAIHLCFMLK